jgi:hypothetical protein
MLEISDMHMAESRDSLFRSKCTPVACDIPNDLCKILGIRDDVNVPEHLQVGKVFGYALLLERSDKWVISVEIGNDLKTAFEGDDLPFEMSLQDPAKH